MDIAAQVEKDRVQLLENLQRMQAQYEELGRRVQQQAGAVQYCDMILARVREEQKTEADNGSTIGFAGRSAISGAAAGDMAAVDVK